MHSTAAIAMPAPSRVNRGPVVSRRNVLKGLGGYLAHPHLQELANRQRQAAAITRRVAQLRRGARLSVANLRQVAALMANLADLNLNGPDLHRASGRRNARNINKRRTSR